MWSDGAHLPVFGTQRGQGTGASLYTVFLLVQSGAHGLLPHCSRVRYPSQTEPHPLVRRKEMYVWYKTKQQSKPCLSQLAKGQTNNLSHASWPQTPTPECNT